MQLIHSKDIFKSTKLQGFVNEIVVSEFNIFIFGLPNSGKSTLAKAICKADSRFSTLAEEEILSAEDVEKILINSSNLWCVGHQYPSQNQNVSESYLVDFVKKMKLNLDKWNIIRIKK